MRDYRNILVVQTAFPGDIVLTTPLFKALKKIFPKSRLSVVTTPQGIELLSDIKEIDFLVSYDKRGREKSLLNFFGLIGHLRKERFDLCVSPHSSSRTAFMIYGAGIPVRIGFADASMPALYNRKVNRDKSLHEVERVLSLLGALNVNWEELDKSTYLEISPEPWNRAKKIFSDAGISSDEMVVGIAPGSVWGTKRWPADRFAVLIDRLVERYDARIVLLGSPNEGETRDEIMALVNHKAIDLVGKTTLRDLIPVIDRCQLLIGNDSAPGHIAAARMVPVVSIFGPTVPLFGYAPYGKDVYIVEKEIPCRPCHHHGPDKCPEGHFRCMRDIAVDDVMVGVERFMNKK